VSQIAEKLLKAVRSIQVPADLRLGWLAITSARRAMQTSGWRWERNQEAAAPNHVGLQHMVL